MIIVFSEIFDPSTDNVLMWLKKMNQPVVRINSIQELINQEFKIEFTSALSGGSLGGSTVRGIKSVWFRRRPEFSHVNTVISHKSSYFDRILQEIKSTQGVEESTAFNFVEPMLHHACQIGSLRNSSINKLFQLQLALECGLRIPPTEVITAKADLVKFYEKHGEVIIKPLSNMSFVRYPDVLYANYTKTVSMDFIDRMPDNFSPTLCQGYIDKEFEIRSFFLGEEEYSMAIFSQKNQKTVIDFRKYDRAHPNRRVPFNLPDDVRMKLIRFMNKAGINTGSFDIIRSKSGQFVFLEVNPVGQFGMVSVPCNYYIEKRIAEKLTTCN